jgi:hypothetical protein
LPSKFQKTLFAAKKRQPIAVLPPFHCRFAAFYFVISAKYFPKRAKDVGKQVGTVSA